MKLILGTANLNKKYGLNFKNNPSKSEFLKIVEYSKKKNNLYGLFRRIFKFFKFRYI